MSCFNEKLHYGFGFCPQCGKAICDASNERYGCTRTKGHKGPHGNYNFKDCEWPNKDDEIKINLDRPDLDEML